MIKHNTITKQVVLAEELFRRMAERPRRKGEDTITRFDRDIYYFDKDRASRNYSSIADESRVTYEDHRRAVETAVNMLNKRNPYDITMSILFHRFFTDYRSKVFVDEGSFHSDFTYVNYKVSTLFNFETNTVPMFNMSKRLDGIERPALVSVNHATGTVKKLNLPEINSLKVWAVKLNAASSETTTYLVLDA